MVVRSVFFLMALTLAAACGDDQGSTDQPRLEPLPEPPVFAVVSTDTEFSSSVISVLDGEGMALDDQWLTSGTASPGLVAPLSGDVVVALGSGPDGSLTVIDRFGTDVVTRVGVPEGLIRGQVQTKGDPSYAANPQDVVFESAARAWVSRYGPNPDGPPADRGTDLWGFDPRSMAPNDERIDLSQFDTVVDGTDVPARPELMVFIDDRVLVALTRLAFLPDFSVIGARGTIAIVDPASGSVGSFALPDGRLNCGKIRRVPGTTDRVLVACQGVGFGPDVFGSAGLYELSFDGDDLTLEERWEPGANDPVAVNNVVPLSSGFAVGVAFGDFVAGTGDELYLIDLASDSATLVSQSNGPFELGQTAFDATTRLLLVPDSGEDVVERWRFEAGALGSAGPSIELAPSLEVFPRSAFVVR